MNNQTWSSKFIFILVAIGAAAGLGNLWRFPYLAYQNGGGAYLLAYILCLFLIAKPLMMMEIAFGQKLKKDFVEALGDQAGKFGKFVGWLAIMVLILITAYFAVIVGWAFDFLAASPLLEWGNDAQSFFHQDILQLTESPDIVGNISPKLVWGILATYLAIYFSIFKELKSVSKVVKWTVPVPFLLLLILSLNTATLDGAWDGFRYFLVPDWSKLLSVQLWKDALNMSLFSVNVGFVMTYAYSVYNKSKEDILSTSLWIGFGDLAVSLVSGLAVFGTLGFMANQAGVDISEIVKAGPTLAFVTIPTGLAQFPHFAGLFAVFFFLAILTLSIDTIFAFLEAISMTIKNQFKWFRNKSSEKIIAILCIVFFFASLIFATGNGLFRLDVVDHFLFAHMSYIGALIQMIVIAWIFGAEKIREFINSVSQKKIGKWFTFVLKFAAPAVFIYLYVSSLPQEFARNYGDYSSEFLWKWGGVPVILAVIIAIILSFKKQPK